MGFKKTKVLLVDPSAFTRKAFRRMLGSDPDIRVSGDTSSGSEAKEIFLTHNIDVVVLALDLPDMAALELLEWIMKERPTPVLIASSISEEGKSKTLRVLDMGAVDFVDKSACQSRMDLISIQDEFLAKVKMAAGVKMHKLIPREKKAPAKRSPFSDIRISAGASGKPPTHLVAIGSSTGGPGALEKTLEPIPADYPGAIVIVQHMPPGFTAKLASRLNDLCAIRVTEAVPGEVLEAGSAYIAKGGLHLKIRKVGEKYKSELSPEPRDAQEVPSVDALFGSVARVYEGRVLGVVLTGMGRDGAEGALELKREGHLVIAQDEASSVVYGMPKAARENGAAKKMVGIDHMAKEIVGFHA